MGLLDQFSNLDENQTQGLLAAASQMLQQSGPSRTPTGFGQIAGGGMMAYQGAMAEAKKRKQEEEQQRQMAEMRALQMRAAQGSLQDSEAARTQQAAIQAAARGSMRTPGMMAGAMPGGPTPGNAAQIPNMEGGFDKESFLRQVMQIDPVKGLALAQQLKKQGTEYGTDVKVGVGPDGKPFSYLIGKDGSQKRLDGTLPRDKIELMNLGGKDVAYNPYALQAGQQFDRTQSPDSRASNGIARERLNFDRSQVGKPSFNAEVGGFISPPSVANPNGGITPLAGFDKRAPKAPTEFQGKSAAFGLRATEAHKVLSSLEGNGVTNTGIIKSIATGAGEMVPFLGDKVGAAIGSGMNMLPGVLGGPNEQQQQVEQARRDFINATLRQESGAAIGQSEFENANRQYFPQPGDTPSVIKQKARNREMVIQGFDSNAGRHALTAPGQDVVRKYNPATGRIE